MRTGLLALALAAMLAPLTLGCGGSESSYKDRQGDINPETVDVQPPSDMMEKPDS